MKIFFLFIFFSSLLVSAEELHVFKTKNNLVKFISDAPIEDFEGTTDNIDGYVFWEGDSLTNNGKVYFEVDLKTIDTGIGLRNRHMRDNYLETDKYRFAKFEGEIFEADKLNDGEFDLTVKGEIDIHGVKKSRTIEGKFLKDGNLYNIITDFEVNLKDHNIDVPSFMFLKIDEVMQLELNFYLEKK